MKELRYPITARCWTAVALLALVAGAGCSGADDPDSPASRARALMDEPSCEVDVFELEDMEFDPITCSDDTPCPCGSSCDLAANKCTFECLPPDEGEPQCSGEATCNLRGRCVEPGTPDEPAEVAPTLSSTSSVIELGTETESVTLELRFAVDVTELPDDATSTVVNVTISDEMSVDCGAGFASACTLSEWSFGRDSEESLATRTVSVRRANVGSNATGNLRLVAEDTAVELSIPVVLPSDGLDADYSGVLSTSELSEPLPVMVHARGDYLVIKDASRLVAESGVLVLDAAATGDEATRRYTTWLSNPEQAGTPDALGYRTEEPFARGEGELFTGGFSSRAELGDFSAVWNLEVARLPRGQECPAAEPECDIEPILAECNQDADCAGSFDAVCPTELRLCVPALAWSAQKPELEGLVDTRGDAHWASIEPGLASSPALADEQNGSLLEGLLCSEGTSYSGLTRSSGSSLTLGTRSRDLLCPNGSSGAVGLATHRDRGRTEGAADLFEACLEELESAPRSWSQASARFASRCANLGRFYGALRAAADVELNEQQNYVTSLAGDARTRGLFLRLVQQWTQLQGFVASEGLASRGYADIVAEDRSELLTDLERILTQLEHGWNAILDDRVIEQVKDVNQKDQDYREGKEPAAYWTFDRTLTDIISGAELKPSGFSPSKCHTFTRDSLPTQRDCPPLKAIADKQFGIGGGDVSVTFAGQRTFGSGDEIFVGWPPYFGGTILLSNTLSIVVNAQSYYGASGGRSYETLTIAHPVAGGGVEYVTVPGGFSGLYYGGVVSVVRDTARKTYTVYKTDLIGWSECADTCAVEVPYYKTVGGELSGLFNRNRIVVNGQGQMFPKSLSHNYELRDLTLWNTIISEAEHKRLAAARGRGASGRQYWPKNLPDLDGRGEFDTPLETLVFESQAAQFDLMERYLEDAAVVAASACGGDASARQSIDQVLARTTRLVKQSMELESSIGTRPLAGGDDRRERRDQALELVRSKRSGVVRQARLLRSCVDPYGLAEEQVPLYFSLPDNPSPTQAFFAASNFLEVRADKALEQAQASFSKAQESWLRQRNSQIQQTLDNDLREQRLNQIRARYGTTLRRLCGLSGVEPQDVPAMFTDGELSADDCFIKDTDACAGERGKALGDVAGECLRGAVGVTIAEANAARAAYDAAHQDWENAAADAAANSRLCIDNEVRFFGCDRAQRYEDVTCPDGHQGTLELIDRYNKAMADAERSRAFLGVIADLGKNLMASGGTPAGLFAAVGLTGLNGLSADLERHMSARSRGHKRMLQVRAKEDELDKCWVAAESSERRISSAEDRALAALNRMTAGALSLENQLAEVRQAAFEAPLAVAREQNRPRVDFAFHFWLDSDAEVYRRKIERARRYAYLWLRAAEYEAQQSLVEPGDSMPSRAGVLSAWRPADLDVQSDRLKTLLDSRTGVGARATQKFVVIDLGQDVLGIDGKLTRYLEDVTSDVRDASGRLLGKGIRFTYLPGDTELDAETPIYRCAERLWGVNTGLVGVGSSGSSPPAVQVFKSTRFQSGDCNSEGLRSANVRPQQNLFVSLGDGNVNSVAAEQRFVAASTSATNFATPGESVKFRTDDAYTNGRSTELGGMGLYGEYIVLIPTEVLDDEKIVAAALDQFKIRLDYVSLDDSPVPTFLIEADESGEPIVVE